MKNMGAKIHYAVIAKLIIKKNDNDGYEFLEINKEFRDDNPIDARKAAFGDYQNLIDVLLESKGLKYESDKQARKALNSFIDPLKSTNIQII